LAGGQGVAGSNPASPTNLLQPAHFVFAGSKVTVVASFEDGLGTLLEPAESRGLDSWPCVKEVLEWARRCEFCKVVWKNRAGVRRWRRPTSISGWSARATW